MKYAVIAGQYIPGDSLVHRMDPRSKLILVVLFMSLVFVSAHPASLGAAAVLVAGAFLITGISFRFFWKGMRLILIIIVLTFLMHALITNEGTELVSAGWLSIYSGGVATGALLAGRLALLVTFAVMLTLTTTPVDLTDAMERLLHPLKRLRVPVHELALMMSIALRFIPTLLEETERIIKAQSARGASFSQGSLWKRIQSFTPVLVPLFAQSFRRAEDLADAMEARGYEGGKGRTRFRVMTWHRRDTAALLVFACYGLFAVWTRFW
ncbi:energy-coupling factor transporter transmembrane component T family protein [Alkalicoccus chagannorensis]|uniref:energy-coupling factor transporter transmembrane component T family protein n=1 Tax=Alkalicoccus chagannorensis TaxID=427072 RepID=UPI00042158BD|nr:energy-coupling factor transporter transmembrane component T [Alkalicoccus chagannorensis]